MRHVLSGLSVSLAMLAIPATAQELKSFPVRIAPFPDTGELCAYDDLGDTQPILKCCPIATHFFRLDYRIKIENGKGRGVRTIECKRLNEKAGVAQTQ